MSRYARLKDGLVVVSTRRGLLLDGGPSRHLFSGESEDVLRRIVPLLDGKTDTPALTDVLRLPTRTIDRTIGLLEERDLVSLSDTPRDGDSSTVPEMLVFLRRTLPRQAGDAAWERLRSSSVSVIGECPLSIGIAEVLQESGVGRVELARRPDANDLSILVLTPGDQRTADERRAVERELSASRRAAWLRVCVSRAAVAIGPIFNAPGARCYRCFADAGLGLEPRRGGTTGPALQMGQGLAVGAALRYVGRYGSPWALRGALEVDLQTMRSTQTLVVNRPECSSCGSSEVTLGDDARALLAYDQSIESPPSGGDPPALDGDGPTRSSKHYLTLPRVHLGNRYRLPPGSRRRPTSRPGPSRVQVLAWVLERAAGGWRRSGQVADRWTPSIDGLNAVRLYVVGDALGEPGAFYFDDSAGDLIRLPSPLSAPRDRLWIIPAGDASAAERALGRYARRGIYQEAGMALAQMWSACEAVGWHPSLRDGWNDDSLLTALGSDPTREHVAAVVEVTPETARRPIGRLAPESWRAPQMAYEFAPAQVDGAQVARVVREAIDAVDRIWEGTEWPRTRDPLLLARRVRGLPGGLYRVSDDPREPWAVAARDVPNLRTYLDDREIDVPALILFPADLAAAMDALGAFGYRYALERGAATARAAHAIATADGLVAGLFARLPPSCLAMEPGICVDHVTMGLAVGHPPSDLHWSAIRPRRSSGSETTR